MPLVATPAGTDLTAALAARVRAACTAGEALRIVGGNTKAFYGRPVAGSVLDVAGHTGIVRYDPAELVLTARGGTPLAEVAALLAEHGQHLPFEPPAFGATATIGGTVAAGLAGPARMARGPVRDAVLGVRLLTGEGRVLRFGGEVMKNVAGYDVSRLLAGSLGVLGVLLEVSLKVLPRPAGMRTCVLATSAPAALERLGTLAREGAPVTASFWHDGALHLRLEGAESALDEIVTRLGGAAIATAAAECLWDDVREQTHPYFTSGRPLWRLHLPATGAGYAQVRSDRLAFEWNGTQCWLAGVDRATAEFVARHGQGHATLFRRDESALTDQGEAFAPPAPGVMALHRTVKQVFDPAGILNRGRLYADL